MAKTTPMTSFGDVYGKTEFYPDLPKRPLVEVLDRPLIVFDALIVRGYKSKFGESDFALLYCQDLETKDEFTVLCGGEVVVKKLTLAKQDGLLPLLGTISKPAAYYDIV